jgi:hypothetical protein
VSYFLSTSDSVAHKIKYELFTLNGTTVGVLAEDERITDIAGMVYGSTDDFSTVGHIAVQVYLYGKARVME